MSPVFSSSQVTLLHCGAERVTRAVHRLRSGQARWEDGASAELPVATVPGTGWLKACDAAFRKLSVGERRSPPAILILPPRVTLLKQLRIPRVEPAKQVRLLNFAAGQSIPLPLAEVVWDSVVSGDAAAMSPVLLAAARLDLVEALCQSAQSAGFAITQVVPASLAFLSAVQAWRPNPPEPELIVRLEGETATLLLRAGRSFAARTLLLNAEDGADESSLARGLASEVIRSVLHFQAQGGLPIPERVHLGAEAGPPRGLLTGLADRLKLPVLAWDGAEVLAGPGAPVGGGGICTQAEMVGAATLRARPALAAFNLLPPQRRKRQRRQGRKPWLTAAAVLALAAPVPPWLHCLRATQRAEAQWTEIETALVPMRSRDGRIREGLAELAKVGRQVAAWAAVKDGREGWRAFLGDLQARLADVEDVWLDHLAALPATERAPLKLAVTGRMLEWNRSETPGMPVAAERMQALRTALAGSAFVAAVEGERFDDSQPGTLGFHLVLVTKPGCRL